jgi:imidazolonepropionase-like amidohydrolase
MVADQRVSVSTLIMMKGVAQKLKRDFDAACKTVSALHSAGVSILVGTDADNAPGVPAAVPHGESLHDELELLVACGLSTAEVLRAATSLPAKFFGLHDRGVIRPGYRADLVLIGGDPIEDIKATTLIQRVWIAGQEITRT